MSGVCVRACVKLCEMRNFHCPSCYYSTSFESTSLPYSTWNWKTTTPQGLPRSQNPGKKNNRTNFGIGTKHQIFSPIIDLIFKMEINFVQWNRLYRGGLGKIPYMSTFLTPFPYNYWCHFPIRRCLCSKHQSMHFKWNACGENVLLLAGIIIMCFLFSFASSFAFATLWRRWRWGVPVPAKGLNSEMRNFSFFESFFAESVWWVQ